MANLNVVMLMGNITRDPEIRYTPAGVAVGNFGLAVNTPVGKDEKGNQKTETLFVDVVTFGKQAEATAEYLKKGSPVFIEGRLRYRTWEDQHGNKRSKHEITARRIQFLSSKDSASTGNGNQDPEILASEASEDEDIPF